jgi:transcriptional pleiotropic regulator of transition state genes
MTRRASLRREQRAARRAQATDQPAARRAQIKKGDEAVGVVGMVRRLDGLGRIVIPKEVRTALAIGEDEVLEILVDGRGIYLRPYRPGCCVPDCEERKDVRELAPGIHVCRRHAGQLLERFERRA